MKALIKSLDFLSYQPTLYFNGNFRFQTITGGLLTIIFIFIIVGISIALFQNFINKSTKTIIYSIESEFDSTVNLNNVGFFFYLINQNGDNVPESIAKIIAVKATMSDTLVNYTQIKTKKCTYEDAKYITTPNFIKSYLPTISKYECFDEKDDIIIQNNGNSYLNLYITKCSNQTSNIICNTTEEIDKYFISNNIYVTLIHQYVKINHNDKTSPLRYDSTYDAINIPQDMALSTELEYKKIFYYSNDGFIFQEINKYEYTYLDIQSIKNKYRLKYYSSVVPNAISCITIKSQNNNAEKYERSYTQFGNFLGNIGGIINIALYITNLFSYILTKGLYFRELINITLFDVIEDKYNIDNILQNDNKKYTASRTIYKLDKINENDYSNQMIYIPNNPNNNENNIQNVKSIGKDSLNSQIQKNNYLSNTIKLNLSKNIQLNYDNEILKYEFNQIPNKFIFCYTLIFCNIKNKGYLLFDKFVKNLSYKLSSNIIINSYDKMNKIKDSLKKINSLINT